MCVGIQEGPEYLIELVGENPDLPSQMHSARWLNTGSHAMRLYVQSTNPSQELKRLVFVTLNWYGPLFFLIVYDMKS